MPVLDQVIFQAMLIFGVPVAILVGMGFWLQGKMMQAMTTPAKKPE